MYFFACEQLSTHSCVLWAIISTYPQNVDNLWITVWISSGQPKFRSQARPRNPYILRHSSLCITEDRFFHIFVDIYVDDWLFPAYSHVFHIVIHRFLLFSLKKFLSCYRIVIWLGHQALFYRTPRMGFYFSKHVRRFSMPVSYTHLTLPTTSRV